MPHILEIAVVVLTGAGLGFFGGVFGIGGGIVAIPLLALGLGMEQSMAQGTALALMTPNLLITWWRYNRRHAQGWKAMAAIALPGMVTTWLLAHLATRLDQHLLRLIFGGFLCLLAIRLLIAMRHFVAAGARRLSIPRLPLIGIVGGSSMGLLGIGGGLLASPLLTGWLGQRQAVAQGLALSLVAPSAAIALATYAQAQRVDWALGLPMALGGLFTVSAGVALAHRLPEQRLRKAFAVVLLATGLWLVGAALK